MKPGRKPIPRAERLSRGLPVCIVDGCHRAPNGQHAKRCRRHPEGIARARGDGSEVQLNVKLPAAVLAAAKARAAVERVSLTLWVMGALTRALGARPADAAPAPPRL